MAGESNTGQVKWTYMAPKHVTKRDALPKYSRFGESIRHVTPGHLQCAMFCGGKQCKYENPGKFKPEEMAVKGLYSSWITPEILATARPSTEVIKSFKILEQFEDYGIKSIINLQHPGEHASCGYGLQDCGFSYEPESFMEHEIFFYNFGWNDYGVRSLESILDMVKVMSFALQEGKAAVHCHAGLGRTGVLICCYFIYSNRTKAVEAIHLMRKSRPKAVQTRGQIECVKDFYKFLSHLWIMFPSCHHDGKPFTLKHYLTRQKHLLHGFEARELKNIPKIVCVVCSRLLELASVKSHDTDMKWSLSVDVKTVFAEPEDTEETGSSTDRTDAGEGGESENGMTWEREDTATEMKHNPYVESDIGQRNRASSVLQRSQSTEDVINDMKDQGELVRRVSLMESRAGLSRAHSETDLFPPGMNSERLLSDAQHGSFTPVLHGVKLEPLNTYSVKKTKKGKNRKSNKKKRSTDESDAGPNAAKDDGKDVGSIITNENVSTHVSTQAIADTVEDRVLVAKAMGSSACADVGVHNRTEKLKRKLNSSEAGWDELRSESDPWVLSRLVYSWMEELAEPVLSASDVDSLCEGTADPVEAVRRLSKGTRHTVECFVTTACELFPLPSADLEDRVLRRLSMVLTHNRVLSLTFPRASLDRMASSSSGGYPESSLEDGPDDDSPFGDSDSESVSSSSSFKLLVFLRELVRTLKGDRPSTATSK